MRIPLLVRVEPVIAPVSGRLAAPGTGRDPRHVPRRAVDLVPADPDHDHDHERGDVNERDENDQARLLLLTLLPSCLVNAAARGRACRATG